MISETLSFRDRERNMGSTNMFDDNFIMWLQTLFTLSTSITLELFEELFNTIYSQSSHLSRGH